MLLVFGAMFNVHIFAQGLVFKAEGAMGVSLVNALRSATVALASQALFCSSARPWLCMTRQSSASVAITTLGGLIWVAFGQPKAEPPPGGKMKDD